MQVCGRAGPGKEALGLGEAGAEGRGTEAPRGQGPAGKGVELRCARGSGVWREGRLSLGVCVPRAPVRDEA